VESPDATDNLFHSKCIRSSTGVLWFNLFVCRPTYPLIFQSVTYHSPRDAYSDTYSGTYSVTYSGTY
jgi:hypothetical protein